MKYQDVLTQLEKFNKDDITIMDIRSFGSTPTIEVRLNNVKLLTISRPQMKKLVELGYHKYFY
tara:strand:- start:17366 stop:17554 length:189 start_codon:yes stop_codon:yes gene_type:complete